jgi:hypothetical protein
MDSKELKAKMRIKYGRMIDVLKEGQKKYEDEARKATTKYAQDIYLTGAETCISKIKMINEFLGDLNLIEAFEE